MDLSDLLTRYEDTHSRRALGGVRALSGFDYQLRVYLADFIEKLAAGESVASAGDEFSHTLEALSDVAQEDEHDNLVLVQVKRTLTRSALADAAAEFATIDYFLRNDIGTTDDQLPRYRVVAQFSNLAVQPSWDEINLPSGIVEKQPQLAESWSRIRRDKRLELTHLDRDPWWRLIAATFHLMVRPFDFVRAALETCLRRGELSAGDVRQRVAELFTTHRRAPQAIGRALTDADFKFSDPENLKPLVVGYRPSLSLLRDRQFMPRRRHVDAACEELEARLSVQHQAIFHELPVFWIAGRSGCGKSALLLQVMDEMVRHGRRVVWLEDDTSKQLPLVKSLHPNTGVSDEEVPDLIFIDDMYAPRGQQDLDLDELRRLIGSAPEHRWPVVATCGPPEFEERLQQSGTRDCLQVHEWLLPPVRSGEADELREWFGERTGVAPQVGTAFAQSEGLIVSMAFEIRHGLLDPFANRFRNRLQANQLDKCLRIPLALNRLYVLTPANWLEEPEWERLDELNRDSDFSVLEVARGGRYLRLTHPHISDSIYRAIRIPATPRGFANDLADALRRSWQTDLFTLRQLLRVISAGHERLDALDMQHLAERTTTDWLTDHVASRIDDADALADVLVSWACWHARSPDLNLEKRLDAPLLEKARDSLQHSGSLWPSLWERLVTAWPDDAGLIADAQDWLNRPESSTNLVWSFIWERLWQLAQSLNVNVDAEGLAENAWMWLSQHDEQPDWHYVWRLLLQNQLSLKAFSQDAVLWRGWRWLTERRFQTVDSKGRVARQDQPAWAFVWEDLLDAGHLPADLDRGQLLDRGHDWLDGREDRNEWSYLWQRLVDEEPLPESIVRGQLLVRGHDWLEGREDRNAWSYVWQRLVDEASLPESIDRAQLLLRGQACGLLIYWPVDRGAYNLSLGHRLAPTARMKGTGYGNSGILG